MTDEKPKPGSKLKRIWMTRQVSDRVKLHLLHLLSALFLILTRDRTRVSLPACEKCETVQLRGAILAVTSRASRNRYSISLGAAPRFENRNLDISNSRVGWIAAEWPFESRVRAPLAIAIEFQRRIPGRCRARVRVAETHEMRAYCASCRISRVKSAPLELVFLGVDEIRTREPAGPSSSDCRTSLRHLCTNAANVVIITITRYGRSRIIIMIIIIIIIMIVPSSICELWQTANYAAIL